MPGKILNVVLYIASFIAGFAIVACATSKSRSESSEYVLSWEQKDSRYLRSIRFATFKGVELAPGIRGFDPSQFSYMANGVALGNTKYVLTNSHVCGGIRQVRSQGMPTFAVAFQGELVPVTALYEFPNSNASHGSDLCIVELEAKFTLAGSEYIPALPPEIASRETGDRIALGVRALKAGYSFWNYSPEGGFNYVQQLVTVEELFSAADESHFPPTSRVKYRINTVNYYGDSGSAVYVGHKLAFMVHETNPVQKYAGQVIPTQDVVSFFRRAKDSGLIDAEAIPGGI